jgi:hypothetical protein
MVYLPIFSDIINENIYHIVTQITTLKLHILRQLTSNKYVINYI